MGDGATTRAAGTRRGEAPPLAGAPPSGLAALADRDLVARCLAAGRLEDEAFAALYARHAARVFGFLLRLTGAREAAEDALQETFVRVHRSLARFDPERDLATWLLQIARYVAIDGHRVEAKVKRLEDRRRAEGPPPADGPRERAERDERQRLVDDVLAGLSIDDRSLLVLRHWHELTFAQIGEVTDCSARTAQNRVEAAARRFQLALLARRGDARGGAA